MKRPSWQITFGVALVVLSALLYGVHYLIFHDYHHIFIYLVGDVAFVPVEVLLVTMVIHQLLSTREKRALLNKLYMVIGAFFSEVGTELLQRFTALDPTAEVLTRELSAAKDWAEEDFQAARQRLGRHEYHVEVDGPKLEELKEFLIPRRTFLLDLLANPNLLEHESFTDLLWAVNHLTEELLSRTTLKGLPDTDCKHLGGDVERAYGRLVSEWLGYMTHLEEAYPYLFSLAMRTNPFDPDARPELT